MNAIRSFLLLTAMMTFASVSQAQRAGHGDWGRSRQLDRVSVELQMGGQEFIGDQTLFLRSLLAKQNPWLDTRDLRLENITIVTKSKMGLGTVRLVIDGQVVSQARVAGDERNYYRNEARTYSSIRMQNTQYRQDNTWRLQTSGNIRIAYIKFNLAEERRGGGGGHGGGYPGPIEYQSIKLASGKLDKLIDDRDSHSVRMNNVRELRIKSTSGSFLLRELVVSFSNGGVQRLPFNVEIKRGRDVTLPMRGEDIRHVEIVGTSTEIIGSRAEYQIDAIVGRSR